MSYFFSLCGKVYPIQIPALILLFFNIFIIPSVYKILVNILTMVYDINIIQPKANFRVKAYFEEGFMYTIGQVAAMFGIPVSTLRYYDKESFP